MQKFSAIFVLVNHVVFWGYISCPTLANKCRAYFLVEIRNRFESKRHDAATTRQIKTRRELLPLTVRRK